MSYQQRVLSSYLLVLVAFILIFMVPKQAGTSCFILNVKHFNCCMHTSSKMSTQANIAAYSVGRLCIFH